MDNQGLGDLGYSSVKMVVPGTFLRIPGLPDVSDGPDALYKPDKTYEVLDSTLIWPKGGFPCQWVTIQAVDDEGNELDDPDRRVNLDMWDYIII